MLIILESMGLFMRQKIKWKNILILQMIVVIYTFSTICAKMASGQTIFSIRFFLYLGLEVLLLGIYAICWQQMIKRLELSVAYINRSLALCWSMLWSCLFFKETITIQNIIGVLFIVLGIMIINTEKEKETKND